MVGAVFFALDLVADLCLNRRRREEVNSATFEACSEYQIPAGLMMRGVESYWKQGPETFLWVIPYKISHRIDR